MMGLVEGSFQPGRILSMTTASGVPRVFDNTASDNAASDNGASDNGEGIHMRDGGGSLHGGSQLRDIEELVAKLQVVSRQLEFPARTIPAQPYPCAELK
jgi:hypothetical protein